MDFKIFILYLNIILDIKIIKIYIYEYNFTIQNS